MSFNKMNSKRTFRKPKHILVVMPVLYHLLSSCLHKAPKIAESLWLDLKFPSF